MGLQYIIGEEVLKIVFVKGVPLEFQRHIGLEGADSLKRIVEGSLD